jgi:hypothetical protein
MRRAQFSGHTCSCVRTTRSSQIHAVLLAAMNVLVIPLDCLNHSNIDRCKHSVSDLPAVSTARVSGSLLLHTCLEELVQESTSL